MSYHMASWDSAYPYAGGYSGQQPAAYPQQPPHAYGSGPTGASGGLADLFNDQAEARKMRAYNDGLQEGLQLLRPAAGDPPPPVPIERLPAGGEDPPEGDETSHEQGDE